MCRNCIFFLGFFVLVLFSAFKKQKDPIISYLPLGDSYTICTGASEQESWPYLLTNHLNANKIKCRLLDNPARNGFTTSDLIKHELPLLKEHKPNFVTLLIGVNDWVRKVPTAVFTKNLNYILDEIQNTLPDKRKVLLITIPDFGVTPQGKHYANGRNISTGIFEFNEIIKREAKNRNLTVIDIFGETKKMELDNSLIAEDGLHPSAKEYAVWETMILPEALKLLKAGERK